MSLSVPNPVRATKGETRINMVQHFLCDIGVRYWGPAKPYKMYHFAVGQISTIIQPNFSSVLTTSRVWRPPPGTIDGVCICEPKRFCYHDNFSWEITLISCPPTNAPFYWSERWISHTRTFPCIVFVIGYVHQRTQFRMNYWSWATGKLRPIFKEIKYWIYTVAASVSFFHEVEQKAAGVRPPVSSTAALSPSPGSSFA